MKKTFIHLSIIVFLLSLFLIPLFTNQFYASHDGEAHAARFAAYFKAFQDGQFIPRWAGDLNYGYGTPVFIFYYPLPGYIGSLLHLFGFSFEMAFKTIIALSFIGSGISFYFWSRLSFTDEIAITGAMLYGLAPYHFLNLYVRGDVAELLSLAFVPLVFYFIERFAREKSIKQLVLGAIVYALVILSHNGISLMFSPVFLFYIFLKARTMRTFFQSTIILLLGLLLSAFFWMPALYEGKYTYARLFIGDLYKEHFATLQKLFYSEWGFGPHIAEHDGLSPQIGILYVSLVGACIYYALLKKENRSKILSWLTIFLLAVFISTAISAIFWQHLPLIKLFQFPWRFTALSSFAAAILGCYGLMYTKVHIRITFLLALLLLSTSFMKVKSIPVKSDDYYMSYPHTTYFHWEATSIWTAGDPGKRAEKDVEVITGDATINYISMKSNEHVYNVKAQRDSKLLDNTIYFPGWKVFLDGEKVPIEFQDSEHRGLITYSVPKGDHGITVRFEESPIRLLADIISVIAVFFVGLLFLLRNRIQTFQN